MTRRVFAPGRPHGDTTDAPRAPEVPNRVEREAADDLRSGLERLLPSADECARIEKPIVAAALVEEIEKLLAQEPGFAALIPGERASRDFVRIFLAVPLPPALTYKLTVARDRRPEILDHSMRVAYCAAALAEHCGMPPHEVVNAAAAGLFHDIGLLHVDPALLHHGRALSEHERHHLYSHPLTAYLILEHSPIWHPVVSTAVLEHHERLDGSGYPKGLAGERLSALGQLLAVAELAATLLTHGGYASRDRLGIVLRMNEDKLNRRYCEHLMAMFPAAPAGGAARRPTTAVLETLLGLSIAFQSWQAIAAQAPLSPLTGFVAGRMAQLARSLAEVGIDLDYWSTFSNGGDLDAAAVAELEVAAREGTWQLQAIGGEICRRWKQLAGGSEDVAAGVLDWIVDVERLRAT